MKTMKDLMEKYIYIKGDLCSKATIKLYRNSLGYLVAHFGADRSIDTLGYFEMIEWRKWLATCTRFDGHPYIKERDKKLSAHTIRRIMSDAGIFFNWLILIDKIAKSPLQGVKKPKAQDIPQKAISPEGYKRLLSASAEPVVSKHSLVSIYAARNPAIISFLASTGCRVGGLCSATLSELDLDGGRIGVVEKGYGGGKHRFAFLSEESVNYIHEWLKVRPDCTHDYLFCSIEGKPENRPITDRAVRQMISRTAKRAGIKEPYNPHSLRHRAAREWLKNGADLATVSQLLGHASIEVTAKHYARFEVNELHDAHKKFLWA